MFPIIEQFSMEKFKRAACLSCQHSCMAPDEEIYCNLTKRPIERVCDNYCYEPGTDVSELLTFAK